MKKVVALAVLVFSMSAFAQQPAADLQTQFDALQIKAQLYYEKLHSITEFQQWLEVQKQIAELQQRAQAQAQAAVAKAAAKPATPAPVKK
jgi:hypothetical protein